MAAADTTEAAEAIAEAVHLQEAEASAEAVHRAVIAEAAHQEVIDVN